MKGRFYMPRSSYIPKEAQPHPDNSPAGEIYTYERNGKPYAIAFSGQQAKPAWHFSFIKDEHRTEKIREFFESVKGWQERKAQHQAERKAYHHDLKVGDILVASWGYDQTNVNFFEIVATTEKTVTFGEITQRGAGNEGFMCENVLPHAGHFKDEKRHTRPVSPHGITFAEFKGSYALHLHKWDGKPEYSSWYA